ncbi:putative 50S ribosomal protein L22 [Neospora caninum Liverpool]|uniref:Putative 50S ribosomal protein L22 n=1 Tax=Neospora caninum (strain Liverpool) TaxID=572307 RepID=F0VNG2_NEOCL|nr:putative 50S ribosomal protein L22 [Neospora caninum Liverpool]CBZ55258.1 putative 50S ribosomal protein L22 [Neospora caninum Liverpool]|eukprot:XP_003885286.1 putative 50S ribosomal protein L22 [Neospora caninum Liverpool]
MQKREEERKGEREKREAVGAAVSKGPPGPQETVRGCGESVRQGGSCRGEERREDFLFSLVHGDDLSPLSPSSREPKRSVSSATFFAPSTTFSFFFFPSSPSFASSLVSSSSPFSSSRLNATHQDLPALAPPGGDPPADLSSSSPGFLSVEVDNFEPSPAYLPPRLPVPMHTFRPHPARQPGAAASLLPPIAPGVSPAPRLARAEARYQRLSPIKTRRVLAEIKGMSIGRALAHLATSPRRPAFQVFKTIQSALANAIHAFGAETLQPRIKSITANNGPVMKRPFFRARGKMDILRRPTTHIRVILEV